MSRKYKALNGVEYDDPSDYDAEKYEMRVVDTVNYTPSEIEYIDKKTRERAGYWAFGFFDPESFGGKVQKWTITYNPKPIPGRRHDYDVCHDDYDIDRPELFFTAESKEQAQNEIDILEDEWRSAMKVDSSEEHY